MIYIVLVVLVNVFFFSQNTAYEMRISDWSSDVCSSDLTQLKRQGEGAALLAAVRAKRPRLPPLDAAWARLAAASGAADAVTDRSEERRVGEECVSTC